MVFLFCDKSPEKVLACFDMIKLLFFLLIFRYITIVSVLVSTRELFIFARSRRFTIIDFWVIISFSRPLPCHNIPFPYLAENSVELFYWKKIKSKFSERKFGCWVVVWFFFFWSTQVRCYDISFAVVEGFCWACREGGTLLAKEPSKYLHSPVQWRDILPNFIWLDY